MKGRKPKLSRVRDAFIAAPLGGAALIAGLFLISSGLTSPTSAVHWISVLYVALVVVFFSLLIIGYTSAVVLGVPGYLLFRYLGWIRRTHWILLGAAIGGIAAVTISLALWLTAVNVTAGPATIKWVGKGDNLDAVSAVVVIGVAAVAGMTIGAVCGSIFALIAKVEPPSAEDTASTFD